MAISTDTDRRIDRLAGDLPPGSSAASVSTKALHLFVDDAVGLDTNPGTEELPLKTLIRAEQLIPDILKYEVVIKVQPHTGAGYSCPTFRPRVFSGSAVGIWVIFPEISVIATGTTVSAKNGIEWITTSGGLTPGQWDGKTIEMTSGASKYDRRTIRDNNQGTTDIVPVAEFTTTVVPGDTFQILEPDPGNLLIPTDFVPMVQGIGISETGSTLGTQIVGDPGGWVPGVNIVNAIIPPAASTHVWCADGRLVLIGCEIPSSPGTQINTGSGQLLLGRHSWNALLPPSTEVELSDSSWIGWGAFFPGGGFTVWLDAAPYVAGFIVTEERYGVFGGQHHLNGHIKGMLRAIGRNNGTDNDAVRVSFGKAAPFPQGPGANPGRISADVNGVLSAVTAQTGAEVRLHDETHITNLGTGPCIQARFGGQVHCALEILLDGVNGGDGVSVTTGGLLTCTPDSVHPSITVTGSVANQLFSIGPRSLDAVMADDLNVSGDFVSGARAFWDTALSVTTNTVTLTTIGAVIAVEATTATSTGPKLIQNSASPAEGAVQVTYDATGLATLTFNGTDAVTVASVYIQPEDDGTMVRAI